jgi:hypothetical protein
MAATNGVSVEQRLARLEDEVRKIKEQLGTTSEDGEPWWKSIIGTHENDPDFAEIVRLGREIREKDLVPVWRKKGTRKKPTRKSPASKKAGSKE